MTVLGDAATVDRLGLLWQHVDRAAPLVEAAAARAGDRRGAAPGGAGAAVPELLSVDGLAHGCAALNRLAVERCPVPAAHAGVTEVAGVAVVAPAESGQGKSTLTAALCLAGARYVSDEGALLRTDGSLLPYPKPFALSRTSLAILGLAGDRGGEPGGSAGSAVEEELLPADTFGPVSAVPVPAGLVLVLERRDGARAAVRPLPRREGLAALLRMGFNHFHDPREYLSRAAACVRRSQVWAVTYGHAPEAAELIVATVRSGTG